MYRARREDDGTYSILGVPVFAEVPKGEKGAPFDIDKAWMDAALAKSNAHARGGYFAPLHFEHHDGMSQNFKAGHYRLTRVGKLEVGGKSKFALFADFFKIPEYVFSAIMANEWPYRSVEIVSYEEHEIESIALLDDETPFHKFKLLNADSIRLDPADAPGQELLPVGPVAFARSDKHDGGTRAFFCFREDREMVKIKWDDSAKKFALVDAPEELAGAEVQVVDLPARFKGGSDDLPESVEDLEKLSKAVAAKLKKLQKSDEDDDEDDGGNEHEPPEKPDKMKKGGKHSAVDQNEMELLARLDSLEGKVATFEARDKKREKAAAEAESVDDAVKSLKADGYHVSGKTVAAFRKYAAKGALDEAVADYRRLTTRDGPPDLGDEDRRPAAKSDDKLVAAYAAQGDAAHAAALKASAEFENLKDAGMRRGTDEERSHFFRTYMTHRGFKAAG